MRLRALHDGFRPFQKAVMRVVWGKRGGPPGPVAVMSYRRDLHGRHFARAFHEAMNKAERWSKRDVELFAAFVSKQNQCTY